MMNADELFAGLGKGEYKILDTRAAADYKTAHIPGAVSADVSGAASGKDFASAEKNVLNAIKGDAEGLVNMPLQIKGLKLSISLREDTDRENTIWVSLRSVDDFPCNEVAARFFNGGGHLNASGGRLNCSLDEAVEIVKKALVAFEDTLKK